MTLCASCREPIPSSSPSDDFCREQCQLSWHSGRVVGPRPVPAGPAGPPIAVRDRRPASGGA